jgi:Flp pilus assembly protein TadD
MSGHEPEAQAAFQDLFQRFPATANAHLLYGYLLFAKDPDAAVAEFKRELEITPGNGTAHALLAWAYLLGDNPAEALPNAQKAAQEQPTVATAQLVLGKALVDTGDVGGGTAHLEKALELEPDNLETHLALAKAYSKAGRKEDAQRERQECLKRAGGEAAPVARP